MCKHLHAQSTFSHKKYQKHTNNIKTSKIFQNNSLNEAHTLWSFSAWLSLPPSRVTLLLLFHCSVMLKPLRINALHLVSVFLPLSCGSEQEVEHTELVDEGSLKQRFTQRLPFRLQLWIPYHTLPHALKPTAQMCVCLSAFLWSPNFKRTPCLMAASKNGPKC